MSRPGTIVALATVLLALCAGIVLGRVMEGAPFDWGFLLSAGIAALVVYSIAFASGRGAKPKS